MSGWEPDVLELNRIVGHLRLAVDRARRHGAHDVLDWVQADARRLNSWVRTKRASGRKDSGGTAAREGGAP